jgi:hypothetical protein
MAPAGGASLEFTKCRNPADHIRQNPLASPRGLTHDCENLLGGLLNRGTRTTDHSDTQSKQWFL